MPKKKRRVPKDGPVWHKSAEQATLDKMPKFNAHVCKSGPHGDAKYNRAKQKRAWQKEFERQGTRNRGSLPYLENEPPAPVGSKRINPCRLRCPCAYTCGWLLRMHDAGFGYSSSP